MQGLTLRTGSPFDSIRQTRPDGSEYWSARDLMAAAGYDRWENFSAVVERAAVSAANQGHDPSNHFREATKVIPGGRWDKQTVSDYEISRFGAYLIFQNGDPRKPEIADAQGYFALRTREAEVASGELDEIQVAERYLTTLKEKKALAEQVALLEGPASHAEAFRQADGVRTIGSLANDFKVYALSRYPDVKVRHRDVFDHAARLGLIIRGNTVRNNEPTARATEAGWVKPHRHTYPTNTRGDQTSVSTHLTPKGEARLWDGLISYINEHGTLTKDGAS